MNVQDDFILILSSIDDIAGICFLNVQLFGYFLLLFHTLLFILICV